MSELRPSCGDWVRIVHDDDPKRPEEPFRDLAGRCGEYQSFDDRPGVPRPHRVALEPGTPGAGLVYVFAVEVVTPYSAIADAKQKCDEARAAIVEGARRMLEAETALEAMRPKAVKP